MGAGEKGSQGEGILRQTQSLATPTMVASHHAAPFRDQLQSRPPRRANPLPSFRLLNLRHRVSPMSTGWQSR